ncbi:MAG TPA: ABC-F family ATP-binding cassette domain-containing protein [Patescibacteria group bacterium]|nr:ABC-F family ATP-binding cassette domain-containing protein [Patescibacteria group bacterium]
MELLQVSGLNKAYGPDTVFDDVAFEMRSGEKVGLIGGNGAGKTTLLRCILGEEVPDGGQVSLSTGATTGYVDQNTGAWRQEGETATLYDELCVAYRDVIGWQQEMRRLEAAIAAERDEARLAAVMAEYSAVTARFEGAGGYEYESNIRRVAYGLGFSPEDLTRRPDEFSGGQKTRIGLARALIRRPDFLFLDEPTNHLDIEMVEWLEDFLREYPGGVLIISHDRYFLDSVAERILELEGGRIDSYRGGYTDYLEQKNERREAMSRAVAKQQAYIAKTEEYIRTYKAGIKSKQARGRQSILSRLERLAMPKETAGFDFFAFNPPGECAERVAEAVAVTAGYGREAILHDLSLLIRNGEGVALVGPNGAGKTTLLKLFTGDLYPTAGKIKLGSRVKLGYFAQEHEGLTASNRVLDEIMREYAFSEERSRHYLGAFLFRGDDVYKLVGDLSGGEKARLALLKLMLTGANFLVLDEPTNHLDIDAREAVEEAIMSFPGTFLTVSHDRYFLDKVASKVLELKDGGLTEYLGNYSDYRDRKAALAKEAQRLAEQAEAEESRRRKNDLTASAKPGGGKYSSPLRDQRERERTIARLEKEISGLEARLEELEQQLNDPASHEEPAASRKLSEEYASQREALDEKYGQWLELTEN